jgi:hypothetical protein
MHHEISFSAANFFSVSSDSAVAVLVERQGYHSNSLGEEEWQEIQRSTHSTPPRPRHTHTARHFGVDESSSKLALMIVIENPRVWGST